jgi:hypothetical protein
MRIRGGIWSNTIDRRWANRNLPKSLTYSIGRSPSRSASHNSAVG